MPCMYYVLCLIHIRISPDICIIASREGEAFETSRKERQQAVAPQRVTPAPPVIEATPVSCCASLLALGSFARISALHLFICSITPCSQGN